MGEGDLLGGGLGCVSTGISRPRNDMGWQADAFSNIDPSIKNNIASNTDFARKMIFLSQFFVCLSPRSPQRKFKKLFILGKIFPVFVSFC